MRKIAMMILMITVALGAAVGVTAGTDLPDAVRIWAEPGDRIGSGSFLSVGYGMDDAVFFTDNSKLAEDWGLPQDNRLTGIFNLHKQRDCGGWITLRGMGDQHGGPGGIGRYSADGGKIGLFRYSAEYRRGDHAYDTTSEMRFPMLTPTPLATTPEMLWKGGFFRSTLRLSERMNLRLGADDIMREGDKTSLSRGQSGLAAPALKHFDTTNRRFYGGLDLDLGRLTLDLTGSVRQVEGTRELDARRAWTDDSSIKLMNAGMGYEAGKTLTILGRYIRAKTDATPGESVVGTVQTDLESTHTSSVLGVLWRPTRSATVKLSGRLQRIEGNGWSSVSGRVSDFGSENPYVYDRERYRRNLRAEIVHTGIAKTRLSLGWSYRYADLTETLTEMTAVSGGSAVGDAFVTENDRTTNTFTFKARRRVNRSLTLKAGYMTAAETFQQTERSDFRYWGDYKRDKSSADVSMRARLGKSVNLDAGFQMNRDSFEREDIAGVKTDWEAERTFGRLSWLAGSRLSLYGDVWMGHEAYLVDGYVDDGSDISAVTYDGTTVRFAPGVTWKYCSRGSLTGGYELIKNTDSVENDIKRWLLRFDRTLGSKSALSLAYRRYEFDENRYDDYIMDRYSLSLSSSF